MLVSRRFSFAVRPLLVGWLLSVFLASASFAQIVFFPHINQSGNTLLQTTLLDEATVVNDQDDAIVLVTSWLNPGAVLITVPNDDDPNLFYSTADRWSITNGNNRAMPVGSGYHVFAARGLSDTFIHVTNGPNTSGDTTFFTNPLTAVRPDRLVFVTANRSPDGVPGPTDPHPLAVSYSAFADQWTVTHLDDATMPVGQSFNVLVQDLDPDGVTPAFVHEATAGSLSFSITYIDHPQLNNAPGSLLLVSQDVTPPATVNPRRVGILYDVIRRQWGIINQDDTNMPLGARFHVFALPRMFTDGFENGNTDWWSSTTGD
ncbi:MAG: hypothetical protein AAF772_11320 [Acidobacteriota bacterium]